MSKMLADTPHGHRSIYKGWRGHWKSSEAPLLRRNQRSRERAEIRRVVFGEG